MANFSIRTLNVDRNGKKYKVHLGAEAKELGDWLDRLAEKYETSQIDQEFFGPITLTIRRAR